MSARRVACVGLVAVATLLGACSSDDAADEGPDASTASTVDRPDAPRIEEFAGSVERAMTEAASRLEALTSCVADRWRGPSSAVWIAPIHEE